MSDYSVWVVEYGYIDRFPASNLFAAQPNEGHRRMPYCFGVLRSADHVVLVDTGYADEATYARLAAKYGGQNAWADPVDVLARAGVDPHEVDLVLLTHAHFDHAGRVAGFPEAQVVIQRRELDALREAGTRGPRFEFLTRSSQPGLEDYLARLPEGKVVYADGAHAPAPNLRCEPAFDTHTAGSQLVVLDNVHDGRWVFAGDNVYSYENLGGIRFDGVLAPIAMSTGSPTRWLECAEDLLNSVDGEARRILPFHEARIWDQFPSRQYDDGLHLAEISLAGGHASRVADPTGGES